MISYNFSLIKYFEDHDDAKIFETIMYKLNSYENYSKMTKFFLKIKKTLINSDFAL